MRSGFLANLATKMLALSARTKGIQFPVAAFSEELEETSASVVSIPLSASDAGIARQTVYIDPDAATNGDGTAAHPYNRWSFGALRPGTDYLQRAGTTFTGVIHVDSSGTATAPIQLGTYGDGAAPNISGTIDISGASYVQVAGFQIANQSGAAIIIQNGSNNVQVTDNVISGSLYGIWLGNAAGGDNTISNNSVTSSVGAGILIDSSVATANNENVIIGNFITNNGADGIELTSNYTVIQNNTVDNNGLLNPATSGIHLYASSASAEGGSYDTIIGNVVENNNDATMQDGNGILLDQWTHNNVVTENFTTGNDGAGIVLYDSFSNTVTDNVSQGDAVDKGSSHSIQAELELNGALGLTSDNTIIANTFISTSPSGFAAFLNMQAASANNAFSENLLENPAGPNIYQIAGVRGNDLAIWDATLNAHDQFNVATPAIPAFAHASQFSFSDSAVTTLGSHIDTFVGSSPTGSVFRA